MGCLTWDTNMASNCSGRGSMVHVGWGNQNNKLQIMILHGVCHLLNIMAKIEYFSKYFLCSYYKTISPDEESVSFLNNKIVFNQESGLDLNFAQ